MTDKEKSVSTLWTSVNSSRTNLPAFEELSVTAAKSIEAAASKPANPEISKRYSTPPNEELLASIAS